MHFLLLFGIVLLPKAYSLKCYECQPMPDGSPCKPTEKECLPVQQCSVLNMGTYMAGTLLAQIKMKTCAMAEQCVQGSINLGVSRATLTSNCCNSDLCNTMDVGAYSKNAPNGRKCYSCAENKCTTTMQCLGDEDHCVSLSVSPGGASGTMKGCITKNMCGQSAEMMGIPGGQFQCCEGDLCNSASSTSAVLLLLVASLISMYIIS